MGPLKSHATTPNEGVVDILVHGDPGARSRFISAWLLDQLDGAGFDVGSTIHPRVKCHHTVDNIRDITRFNCPKIRVKFAFDRLSLHLYLFLQKNVYAQIPDFTRDEYSLETYSKVYGLAKECLEQEQQIDYSLYDASITFDQTFDIDCLVELYVKINQHRPSDRLIEQAIKNNQMNQIDIDPNSSCSLAALVLETETRLQVKEQQRLWSIVELYNTTLPCDRWAALTARLIKENYQGIDI
jgi:hypothetical protein